MDIHNNVVPPAIYHIHGPTLGPVSQWGDHLNRCSNLGFNHVLVSSFPQMWKDEAVGSLTGPNVLDLIGEEVGTVTAACKKHRLLPVVDISLERLASYAPFPYIRSKQEAALDPRAAHHPRSLNFLLNDRARAEEVLDWLADALVALNRNGVQGLCFGSLNFLSPPTWRLLIDTVRHRTKAAVFLANMGGMTPEESRPFAGCGFDFLLDVVRPDGRPPENFGSDRVLGPARLITAADCLFGQRLASRFYEIDQLHRAYTRAIQSAATNSAGWLLPMGSEFAWRMSLDADIGEFDSFSQACENPTLDLSDVITEANALRGKRAEIYSGQWQVLSAPDTPIYVESFVSPDQQGTGQLRVINTDVNHRFPLDVTTALAPTGTILVAGGASSQRDEETSDIPQIDMAEVELFDVVPAEPIMFAQEAIKVPQQNDPPRLEITQITPVVGDGRYNVKRTIGDVVRVECDILIEGHEAVGAAVLWRPADNEAWHRVPMSLIVNDRWYGEFQLNRIGQFYYCIEAWRDEVASFQHDLAKKITAGQKVDLEVAEGDLLLERAEAATESSQHGDAATILRRVRQRLKAAPLGVRQQFYCSTEFHQALQAADIRSFVSRSDTIPVWADRYAARFSSWYELFPRSQSASPIQHGTFADVEKRLPALQAMGFDTLYFPPIHPIGRINRKGRNNSLVANSDDPGSPYAIGAKEGGHDALHPELGTFEDFQKLQDAAHRHGMELAIDFALQCAPDHPWLKKHPEWFSWRPDGTIRYAENPPKKYEDIVNFDFYAEAAVPGLWHALRDVVLFWCRQGIRAFRVDNPHTKPFPFWAWLIPEIQSQYPDTLFLAEAFTRPKTMYHLAEIGFSQSYTYFTWRNTKAELEEYLVELTQEAPRDFFRPHFFVNTPDINPYFLQTSGRSGFLIRAALACTLSGLWGMYNGFELCEATPIPGKEEYLDSEKYQLRHWDDTAPNNIIAEISQLNRLRRENPALQSHLGLRFHRASHNQIIYYSKSTPSMDNVLLVAVNLDPINTHAADIEIPLWLWELPDTGSLEATDLINSRQFVWTGKNQKIELSPQGSPYAIWRIRPARNQ